MNALALGLTGPQAGELIAVDGCARRPRGPTPRGPARPQLQRRPDATAAPGALRRPPRLQHRAAHARARRAGHQRTAPSTPISGTRIGNELRLLANEPDPVAAFEMPPPRSASPGRIDAELARSGARSTSRQTAAPTSSSSPRVFGSQHSEQLATELDRLGFTATDRDAIVEAAHRRPRPGAALGQRHLQGRNRPNRRRGRD